MTPHDLDDEFLVWPFRRQLVDETALSDERTVQLVRRAPVRPPVALPPPAPPRRRPLSPLRLAGPVGVAVFVIAAAAAAALGGADHSTRLGAAPVAAAVKPALRAQPCVRREPLSARAHARTTKPRAGACARDGAPAG